MFFKIFLIKCYAYKSILQLCFQPLSRLIYKMEVNVPLKCCHREVISFGTNTVFDSDPFNPVCCLSLMRYCVWHVGIKLKRDTFQLLSSQLTLVTASNNSPTLAGNLPLNNSPVIIKNYLIARYLLTWIWHVIPLSFLYTSCPFFFTSNSLWLFWDLIHSTLIHFITSVSVSPIVHMELSIIIKFFFFLFFL